MSRGHDRERAVVKWFREQDWFAMRAPASLGVVDVIAVRPEVIEVEPGEDIPAARCVVEFVEVKSTLTPYAHFLPADRKRLSEAAQKAGASAWLAWWPSRGELKWIPESEWPS